MIPFRVLVTSYISLLVNDWACVSFSCGVIVCTIYHEKEHLYLFICFKRDIVQNYVVSEIQ